MSPRRRQIEDLHQRISQFAIAVCRDLRTLPGDPVSEHFVRQLVRSSTSPAANYAEAQAAESRRDFVHKMQLCLKELRETAVWLQFIRELAGGGAERQKLAEECQELISIFVASVKTARRFRSGNEGGDANI
jgi:four helix bundle protein